MHSDISHYIRSGFFHPLAPYLPSFNFKLSPKALAWRTSIPDWAIKPASCPNWANREIEIEKTIYFTRTMTGVPNMLDNMFLSMSNWMYLLMGFSTSAVHIHTLCYSFIFALSLLHSFSQPTIPSNSYTSSLIPIPYGPLTFVFTSACPVAICIRWCFIRTLRPFATSKCMQMNSHGWSVHVGVHVMGEGGSRDQWQSEQAWAWARAWPGWSRFMIRRW